MFLKLNRSGGKNKCGAFGMDGNEVANIYSGPQITIDIAR